MDRENSLTLLWPEWGSNPIPSNPQSASNRLRHKLGLVYLLTLTGARCRKVATLINMSSTAILIDDFTYTPQLALTLNSKIQLSFTLVCKKYEVNNVF
jgi:hypothetical protein